MPVEDELLEDGIHKEKDKHTANPPNGIEDLLDLTDSEESSSSSSNSPAIFDNNQPFILELHELSKDNLDPANVPVDKVKKLKKKKGQPARVNKSYTSVSSDSVSEVNSVTPVVEEASKEEYYDARESYHTIQPNQIANNPITAAGQLQVQSEHSQPKIVSSTRTNPTSATSQESSTIAKPATLPE